VEYPVDASVLRADGRISFLLGEPSFTTAERIATIINQRMGPGVASVRNADEVVIEFHRSPAQLASFVSQIENLRVAPDRRPRIVINERTGTIVAGADVMVSSVVISQGDIKVTVESENYASQPSFIGGFANDISSLVVTNTTLEVEQGNDDAVVSFSDTSVGSLFEGLTRAKVGTRRVIGILQAMKAAGALHAEIVVQ
jgi:flagellar P-ring protein precursor FlgI